MNLLRGCFCLEEVRAWLVTLVEGSRVVQAWPGRVTMAKHIVGCALEQWDAAKG